MRKRLAAVGLGVLLGANGVGAQPQPPLFPIQPPLQPPQAPQAPLAPRFPAQPQFPQVPSAPAAPATPGGFPLGPASPQPPGMLPSGLLPRSPGTGAPTPPPGGPGMGASASPGAEVPLPQPEQKFPISGQDVQVKRVVGGWEVWAGQRQLRGFGESEVVARDVARVVRDLRPTEWVTIGGARPVVEYGLTNGRPAVAGAAVSDGKADGKPDAGAQPAGGLGGPTISGAGAKFVQPIDLRTARAEAIRGTWTVRDDDGILFNFGPDKAGAEQAVAVIRKYGFNRVGAVGPPAQPAMSYLFVSLDQAPKRPLAGPLLLSAQIDALTRTGIPVPGVGFTGEMIKIDPKKVEARKDGAEWVVAAGSEVLGRFGPTEWAAREAARTVQDAKFTEFCKLGGTSDLTFFLRDGKAPTRAPISSQGRNFDLAALKVQPINGKWAVTEGNRHLFDVSGQQEGEVVIRVLKAYGFDQLAHLTSGGSKVGITFMVKNRR